MKSFHVMHYKLQHSSTISSEIVLQFQLYIIIKVQHPFPVATGFKYEGK